MCEIGQVIAMQSDDNIDIRDKCYKKHGFYQPVECMAQSHSLGELVTISLTLSSCHQHCHTQ